MARLKFLVFALPALGLMAWHLASSAPRFADIALRQGEQVAASARPAFQARLAEERLRLQGLLAQGAAAWASIPQAVGRTNLKGEALNDAFAALRASLQTGVPDSRKSAMVVALVGTGGTLVSRGDAAAVESLEGLTLKEALQAGPEGAIVDAFGTPHEFYAMALAPPERGGITLVVGGPLISWEITDSVARETGLAAVGLAHAGKLLAAAGQEKGALKTLVAARGKGIQGLRGPTDQMGPLALPWIGGDEPFRSVAARSALPGTTLEVIGLASVEPAMHALAISQRYGIVSLGALTLLGIAMLVLLRGAPAPGMSVVRPGSSRRVVTAEDNTIPPKAPGPEPLPVMESEPGPEAHPDDFQFPGSGAPAPNAAAEESLQGEPSEMRTHAEASPWETAREADGGSPFDSPPPPRDENPFSDAEQPTTIAYPTYNDDAAGGDGEYNPDATRVATVPAELIQQSVRTEPAGSEWPETGSAGELSSPPPSIEPGSTDEAHFQTIYREFLATRERCGESADGLTYERFAVKLRKNREQLTQKYACRTVRFQVYVKEGKAALKATPVRD